MDFFTSQPETIDYNMKLPASVKPVAGIVENANKKFITDNANPRLWADEHGNLYNKDKTKLIAVTSCQSNGYVSNFV